MVTTVTQWTIITAVLSSVGLKGTLKIIVPALSFWTETWARGAG